MRTVIACLAVIMLGACGTPAGNGSGGEDSGGAGGIGRIDRSPGPPEVHKKWTSCADAAPKDTPFGMTDTLQLPRLDDSFLPMSAVLCKQEPRTRPDGGQDMVASEYQAQDIAALLTALRLPDEPAFNGACTADLPVVPWFALLNADGKWVRPGVPADGCHKPRIAVRQALTALKLTEVSSRVVGEIESAEAAKSGCGPSWSDLVSVESSQSGTARRAAIDANPLAGAAQVRLCIFRVPASEQGSGKPAGKFEHGGTMAPAAWSKVDSAVMAAGPARECATPAGRFALLRAADGRGGALYIELDGCKRILASPISGPGTLAQADDALIQLLNP